MSIPIIYREDVHNNPSIKEIKEKVKDQDYRTYTLKHTLTKNKYPGYILDKFFWDYNDVLNNIIKDIWSTIEWKEWNIERESDPNYHQKRLYPNYRKDGDFKTDIRYHYLKNWKYSAHWINSAVDTAFSILDSWKKNYKKGKRKRECPVAKRRFIRVKQTLMKIEKFKDKNGKERERLRISIMPRMFIYIDLSKRYFKLDGKIGEPILTPTNIHLPIIQPDVKNDSISNTVPIQKNKIPIQKIGWDLNKFSMDGFSPDLGWVRIDLKDLYTKHVSYDNKRRRINKIASAKKIVGKRLKAKYSKREKNVCGQMVHNITNTARDIGGYIIKHGFEDLNKYGMLKNKKGYRSKRWNRWINHINWKQITDQMEYKSSIELVDPYHTSKDCSRCGWTNKDLKGEKFECKKCGLVIDRQINAAINIYLRMEGLSQDGSSKQKWFDENILREFTQTGAERKETNELVRSLYDLMKPQFYIITNSSNVLKSA